MSHLPANRKLLFLSVIAALLLNSPALAMAGDQPIGRPMYITLPPDRAAIQAAGAGFAGTTTVTHWSSSFSFGGKTFSYRMVGTSPFASTAATTTVSTEIQPLNFKFSNGKTVSATAAASALANGPIFLSTAFLTGTGQFADVYQRANFAKPIAGKAYHVKLGLPSMRTAMTISVPSASGSTTTVGGVLVGLVNISFINSAVTTIVKNGGFNATTLPILVVGNVFEYQNTVSNCCILGFHSAITPATGQLLTFIYTSYPSPGLFSGNVQDAEVMSHEVAEWMDDPFINNVVPPWGLPQSSGTCFSNLLEVGDPIEAFSTPGYAVTLNSKTYHVQDLAFFSWLAHQTPSIAVSGRYSYKTPAKLTAPPPACT